MMSVEYIGSLDSFESGILSGWACDSLGNNCLVEIVLNNNTIGFFPCLIDRKDLKATGKCLSGGGFRVDITPYLSSGENVASVKFPNGDRVSSRSVTIDYKYSRTVFGVFSNKIFESAAGRKLGVLGNFEFGVDLSKGSVLGKIINVLRLRVSDGNAGDEDACIFFNAPEVSRGEYPISSINYNFKSNLKSYIDVAHKKVFGRAVCLSRREVKKDGSYLIKSELNAAHDGRVVTSNEISALTNADLKSVVIQRVIDNSLSDDLVFDIRVPIIGDEIPFVYLKSRPRSNRFSNINSNACILSVADVLSETEVKKIIEFCRELNFEYGELDVLRDAKSKEIWIVDVNNTPGGPPNGLSRKEMDVAIGMLATTFYRKFIDKNYRVLA